MRKFLLFGLFSIFGLGIQAQTTPCTAGSDGCDESIYSVILGDIDNITDCDFYTNYGLSTDVMEGSTYTLFIELGWAYDDLDEVAAWIDWNDDGDFDDVNEEVFSFLVTDVFAQYLIEEDFTVPTGTLAGPKTLRVRISDNDDGSPISSCGISDYGEVEDYVVNVVVPTVAPTADFTANLTTAYTNQAVEFSDLSIDIPTTWTWAITPATGWSFIGGTTANSQNPQVGFTTPGLYTVSLTAGNTFGSDIEIKTDYIEILPGTTMPCPVTSDECDEYFTNVTLGAINNATGCDNYAFYPLTADLSEGTSYNLSLEVGPDYYSDDEIAAWIDWNNDGDFDDANEEVMYLLVDDVTTVFPVTASINVPVGTSAGLKTLRVRMSYMPDDGAIASCGNTIYGETEDYFVNVVILPTPPVADFVANSTSVPPATTIDFTDLSTNSPTSWAWTITPATGWAFAGGTDATSQNPQVTFNTDGLYTIELTATNTDGSDTETKVDYIEVITATSAPVTNFTASATTVAPAATVNFVDLSTNAPTSWAWTITPATGWVFAGGTNANSQNPEVTFNTIGFYTVELTATNLIGSDTETKTDYIEVVNPVAAPVADFSADNTTIETGEMVSFTDLSTNTPTSWAWSITPATGWVFTGGTSASSQNPEVNFTAAGDYTIQLVAANMGGSDIEIKTNFIEVTDVTGVEEQQLSLVSIYPNPVSESLTIDLTALTSPVLFIELTDLSGRIVYSQANPVGKLQVDLSTEASGVYTVRISTATTAIVEKVIRH